MDDNLITHLSGIFASNLESRIIIPHPPTHKQTDKQRLQTSLLKIIKTRLEGAKRVWPDDLPGVLWAYRTTVRTPTRETLFKLAYGSEAIIPAEIHMANHRVMKHQDEENEENFVLTLILLTG